MLWTLVTLLIVAVTPQFVSAQVTQNRCARAFDPAFSLPAAKATLFLTGRATQDSDVSQNHASQLGGAADAFNISGVNSMTVLENITEITGVSFQDLDKRAVGDGSTWSMFFSNSDRGSHWEGVDHVEIRHSGLGFIKADQTVRGLLIQDNRWALDNGVTHQEIAEPLILALKYFEAANERTSEMPLFEAELKNTSFEFRGGTYDIQTLSPGGWYFGAGTGWLASGPVGVAEVQGSFFNDPYFTNYGIKITDRRSNVSIEIDGLTPHLIHRYGFYQGGEFRISPERIASFFKLK